MRNSKAKTKKKPGIPGEPMSKEEFVALIKEAEKGPFKSLGNLVEEAKSEWRKKSVIKAGKKPLDSDLPLSKEEFISSIKEAEKGTFYTHNEFVLKFN